jgi:hypothetical protein
MTELFYRLRKTCKEIIKLLVDTLKNKTNKNQLQSKMFR